MPVDRAQLQLWANAVTQMGAVAVAVAVEVAVVVTVVVVVVEEQAKERECHIITCSVVDRPGTNGLRCASVDTKCMNAPSTDFSVN